MTDQTPATKLLCPHCGHHIHLPKPCQWPGCTGHPQTPATHQRVGRVSASRTVRLDVAIARAWTRADRRVEARQNELAVEALRLYHDLIDALCIERHPAQLRLQDAFAEGVVAALNAVSRSEP